MSPVVKKKRKKITITSQQLLLVLTAVCAFLLIFTFNTNIFEGILKQAAGYVVVKGCSCPKQRSAGAD